MKSKFKNDIILAIGVITIAIISIVLLTIFKNDGTYVNVIIEGKVKYTYTLDDDLAKTITTDSNGENNLVIRENKVSVTTANCRDKICVNHKPISKVGETIVCLPHKLVIEITDKK